MYFESKLADNVRMVPRINKIWFTRRVSDHLIIYLQSKKNFDLFVIHLTLATSLNDTMYWSLEGGGGGVGSAWPTL